MSQVFGGDSVTNNANVTVTGTTETVIVTGNFVNPPFGNAKGMAWGSVAVQAGTGCTAMICRIRRNPNGENVAVGNSGNVTVTAGNAYAMAVTGSDPIPDGRPVQYALTLQQVGASGNGTTFASNLCALLISG